MWSLDEESFWTGSHSITLGFKPKFNCSIPRSCLGDSFVCELIAFGRFILFRHFTVPIDQCSKREFFSEFESFYCVANQTEIAIS